ncbi:MAG: hypothetical protein ABI041_20590, partial [Bdellovibrionia bacterium]
YIIAYLGFFLMALAPNFGSFALSVILIETSCAAGVFALRLFRAQAIPNADFGKVSGMLFLLQQVTLPFGGMMIACLHNPNQLQKLLLFSSLPVGLLTMALLRWDSLWQSL